MNLTMGTDEIHRHVADYAARHNTTVVAVIAGIGLGRMSYYDAIESGVKSVFVATALSQLLEQTKAPSRAVAVECNGRRCVILSESDFQSLVPNNPAPPARS